MSTILQMLILATSEPSIPMWGLVISIGALALAIGGAIITFGRFQGRVVEKTEKHEKDIDQLWSHQRTQDSLCSTQRAETASQMASLSAKLDAVKQNSEETRTDVKDIRDVLLGKRER